jgi:5-(carboxyamino)imidazole ribonucleotide mutase
VPSSNPLVSVVMGSRSDLDVLTPAREVLDMLAIPHEARVLSAHRTPDALFAYIEDAESRGVRVFIAGAGGAAHLPGVIAAKTLCPVLGVPIPSTALFGLDALLSIVQMPKGIPVATFAVGKPGSGNAALFAAAIVGQTHPDIMMRLRDWREAQSKALVAQQVIE